MSLRSNKLLRISTIRISNFIRISSYFHRFIAGFAEELDVWTYASEMNLISKLSSILSFLPQMK